MLSLPAPYPDELLGSTLLRACRELGVPPVRLLAALAPGTHLTGSFLLPSVLAVLSDATSVPRATLLWEHTMFPYIVARQDPAKVRRLEQAIVSGRQMQGPALAPMVRAVPRRRYCIACVCQDLRGTGEPYWRRMHHLPAVCLCPVHGVALTETDIQIRGALRGTSLTLAHEARARRSLRMPGTSHVEMARYSIRVLAAGPRKAPSPGALGALQARARAQGYLRADGQLASTPLVRDLVAFHGAALLGDADCLPREPESAAWPAMMLRERPGISFATVKHVLLEVFLHHGPRSETPWGYRQPGRQPRDRSGEDLECAQRARELLERAAHDGTHLLVPELLALAGCWQAFRHHRTQFPETDALVRELARRPKRYRKGPRRP